MADPRVLLWDGEMSNLKANIGHILCIGYKWLGEKKVNIISIGDGKAYGKTAAGTIDDKNVAARFAKVLEQADLQVHHFGTYFDEKYLNTRLLVHGLPPVPVVPRQDTWWIAKSKLALNSNRLVTLEQLFGIKEGKTAINWQTWAMAGAGNRKALKEIEHHCVQDVKVLEEVYLKLRPLVANHQNMAILNGYKKGECPRCEGKMVAMGYCVAGSSVFRRFRCQDCKGWSKVVDKTYKKVPR